MTGRSNRLQLLMMGREIGKAVNVQEKIAESIALMMLGLLSRQDIYEKQVSLKVLLIFGILAVVYRILFCKSGLDFMVKAVVPGVMLLVLSFATKEKIGYGDGMTVLVLGVWCGGALTFVFCQIAFFLSGMVMCALTFFKKQRTIAFLPFLLAGLEVYLLLE